MRWNTMRIFGGNSPIVAPSMFLGRSRLGQAPSADLIEEFRRRGPVLPVQIGIPTAMAKQLEAEGQTVPPPEEIPALVDTGASITAINIETAQRLGLQVTGSMRIGGATGSADQPVYAARVKIPDPFIEFDPIQLPGAQLSGTPFQMLIGRNILCSMMLSYDGRKGRFSLIL
jgi:predicted aspartyl protease